MRNYVFVAALAAVASPAFSQVVPPPPPTFSDSATAAARGVVLQAHQLVKDKDLDFGVVTADSQGGTVTISADATGARSTTLGVSALSGTYQAAKFLGEAAPGETVQLTITPPINDEVVSTTNPADTIPVSLQVDTGGLTRTAPTNGQFTVYIGGTFTLAPDQHAGVYTQDFTVKADYQ